MTLNLTRRAALSAGLSAACVLPLAAYAMRAKQSWAPDATGVEMIRAKMKEHGVPGVGIAIVEDGEVSWRRGFGAANLDTGAPVTENTLFQAASLSKPIFAYVVMQAVDRGEIGLDERLVEYYRPSDLAEHPWVDQITVRHVLRHASGLPNWREDKNGPDPLAPAFEPGTDYSYSGEAYHWLQRVMEAATGVGLDELMRRNLFAPAGLDQMSMLWSPERDRREVYGHIVDDDGAIVVDDLQFIREHGPRLHEVAERWGRPMAAWTAEDHEKAAAEMRPHTHPRLKDRPAWRWSRPGAFIIDSASSLRTTAGDYARFLALMMADRKRAEWEISEETRQSMLTPHTERAIADGRLPTGLGWGLERRDDGVVYSHWGKNGRSHISVALGDPARRKGIVVMTNGSNGTRFIEDILPKITNTAYLSIIY